MTEPAARDQELSPEPPREDRRRLLIIAWTNVVVVVCFLLYLMWKWYADPGATWQHWAWVLIQAATIFWIISSIIAKTFAE